MNITDEIRTSHNELGGTSVKFLDFVEQNPGMLERANFHEVFDFKVDLVFPQSWPCFIDKQMRGRLEEAGRDVFRLLKSVPKRVFNNDPDRISRYFHMPVAMAEEQLTGADDGHLKNILGRADLVFTDDGFKCLEYNVSASVGGWSIHFLEPVYKSVPLIRKFMLENHINLCNKGLFRVLFNHIIDAAQDKYPSPDELNIAVPMSDYGVHSEIALRRLPVDKIFKDVLNQRLPGIPGDLVFGHLDHLKLKDNKLRFEDHDIQVLLDLNIGEVPGEVEKAFGAGHFLMYDGPIALLLSNKLNFAVLSEHQDSELFLPEEREIIKRNIPWTRKMTPGDTTFRGHAVNLERHILANREDMVIKPAEGLGGESVYVGRYTPAPLWREVVKLAFRNKNWLVQEFVKSRQFLFQTAQHGSYGHDVIWGVFIFGEHYAGTFLRVLSGQKQHKGVINSHQGAEYSVVLEVDE
jgi:hypothetical protein